MSYPTSHRHRHTELPSMRITMEGILNNSNLAASSSRAPSRLAKPDKGAWRSSIVKTQCLWLWIATLIRGFKKPRLTRNNEIVARPESLTQHLSNALGILFSLLLHGVALAWFLSEPNAAPGQDTPSLIEVSFVRSIPQTPTSLSSRKSSARIEEDYPRSISKPHHRSRTSASKPTKKNHHPNAKSTSFHHHSELAQLMPPASSGSLKKTESHPQATSREKTLHRYHAGSRRNPLPTYPYISRRRGEEGKVTCAVTVTSEGIAKSVEVKESSGYARLDNAAKNVLSTWVFDPAENNSQKIYGFVEVSITFHLTEGVKI